MTINSIATRIAGGARINSAADDAAGLAIAQGLEAQIRGLNQGSDNTRDMQNLVTTAEGGLGNIGDSLSRIRELSVQAASGTNTQADRDIIQNEITQLVDNIQTTVRNTEFNTLQVLDGSIRNANTASNADGTGTRVTINDMAGLAQAITNFNTNGQFDLDELDAAMAEVNGERANLGALSNRFEFTASANSLTALNLIDARSRIADADMAREVNSLRQEEVLNQMQIMMQQNEQERAGNEQLAPLTAPAN
jgi:flagellin